VALATAQGDRASLEDVLPTLNMPCFLYCGDRVGGVLADMQRCAQEIAQATFRSLPHLNHPEAFYGPESVLPPVVAVLRSIP
jgi:hypothetical protein